MRRDAMRCDAWMEWIVVRRRHPFVMGVPRTTLRRIPLGNARDVLVTDVCLGTMTWGVQNTEGEAHAQLDYAVKERGVNFIDTAEIFRCRRRIRDGNREGRRRSSEIGWRRTKSCGKSSSSPRSERVPGEERDGGEPDPTPPSAPGAGVWTRRACTRRATRVCDD